MSDDVKAKLEIEELKYDRSIDILICGVIETMLIVGYLFIFEWELTVSGIAIMLFTTVCMILRFIIEEMRRVEKIKRLAGEIRNGHSIID